MTYGTSLSSHFVAVAEEENISRAARRLHVSQPPLSRQIRDLESELGVSLFEHGGKAIHLTEAGQIKVFAIAWKRMGTCPAGII